MNRSASSSGVVIVASGGLDSTVLTYKIKNDGAKVHLLGFDYGQRHRKELEQLPLIAGALGVPWERVSLPALGSLLANSALTDDVPVPDGHYTDQSMRVTVVPNRNAIILAMAFGFALSRGFDHVAIGAHAGDHPIYADCRTDFLQSFDAMEQFATEGRVGLIAPFAEKTKVEIVALGADLGVPFHLTWSCYKGGSVHCGTCGTCVERKEAFILAGVKDPTKYVDNHSMWG